MEHIHTTATAAQNLKRAAKKRRKSSGESLAASLDAAAREGGYANWKHVTVCQAATGAHATSAPTLPAAIQNFLAEKRAARPASRDLLEALRNGLLFAMDVKDAESVDPQSKDGIEEFEDARLFLASGVWRGLLDHDHEDTDATDHRPQSNDEVLQAFFDDMANYRFFRYLGAHAPKTLDEAFATVFKDFFFPPTHVWIAGKFIDMADAEEVRVDGRVVYATRPGKVIPSENSVAAPAPAATTSRERQPFIARLDIRKWEPGLYEYIASYGNEEIFSEAGFSSISEALKSAADIEGDLAAFQVAYSGYVVGTYPLYVLKANAEDVAQRAVETAASMGDFR